MLETHTRTDRRRPDLFAILLLASASGVWLSAQQPPASSVFTKAQADAGRATYKTKCASCHTPDLGGRDDAPQLAGDDFMSAWRMRTTKELSEFIQATMPPEGPTLSPEEASGVVALILQENGATPGATELTAETAAEIGAVATGKRPGR